MSGPSVPQDAPETSRPGPQGEGTIPRESLPERDLDLTVSIVTWNSKRDIGACLRSIPLAAEGLTYTVTVVDNLSTDGTPDYIKAEFPGARLIINSSNAGFSAGHNLAMRAGVGRRHLVLNPDTECRPNSLTLLSAFLDQHPRAGLVGPMVLTATGEIYPSCRSFPTPGALLFRNKLMARLLPRNPYTRDYLMGDRDHTHPMQAGWLSASVVMASREMLQDIGLLDERFFMYCEDIDWSRRAHDSGWEVWYEPAACVVHLHARSTDQRIPAMIIEHHRSMWKYFCKHERNIRPVWWSVGLGMILFIRATALVTSYSFKKFSKILLNCI